MLVDIIRKVIPARARQIVGVAIMGQASRTWPTLWLYLTVLYGEIPKGLKLKGNWCTLTYKGTEIKAPRNSAGIFLEMFQDEVYEKVWRPEEGDTVIDIGAYVGMFTVKASKLVGPSGKVIAIEPGPSTFSLLEENTKALDNVVLVRKAVWDKEGTSKLYHSWAPGADTLVKPWEKYTEVETITLDKLLKELELPWVDFVKVDAEGAELKILEGSAEALKKIKRMSIATYHELPGGENEMEKVQGFLQKNGFTVIQERGLRGYTYAQKV